MKKVLFLSSLLAAALTATAADVNAPTDGSDLKDTVDTMAAGDTLLLGGGNINFQVNENLSVHDVGSSWAAKSITILFGAEGCITTESHFNLGRATDISAVTLSVAVTADQLTALSTNPEASVTHVIIDAQSDYGIWNLTESKDKLTLTSSELDAIGYTSVGLVTDASQIGAFQYGVVYADAGDTNPAGDTLTFCAKAPEPSTAALSLLALAGLVSRRRR